MNLCVPIIADIDAGFGNEEATYLLAKRMIEAGACAIQLENQVSDAKQCGHQDGKVTVPHEEFLAKIRAVRYAFLELGVEDGDNRHDVGLIVIHFVLNTLRCH